MKSGKVTVVPELKFEITKSSIESAKASSRGRQRSPAQSSGRVTVRKARQRAGAEVGRRLLEAAVEADQARAHDDDHEADREHHVGDQQGR